MLDKNLQQLFEPVVTGLGYELLGVLRLSGHHGVLLRIYIDSGEGIGVDDCEKVSRQISALMDVEEPVRGNYTLEVSSPGLDRPLFALEHFRRFIGNRVKIRLTTPLRGKRNFDGVIKALHGDNIIVADDGEEFSLLYARIEKANLVPGETVG